MAEPLLSVDGLTTEFATPEGRITAIEDVSFDLRPGEKLGIVGESGSGKSVTARSIMGLVASPGRILDAVTAPGASVRVVTASLTSASAVTAPSATASATCARRAKAVLATRRRGKAVPSTVIWRNRLAASSNTASGRGVRLPRSSRRRPCWIRTSS